jgi:hypothetical protein
MGQEKPQKHRERISRGVKRYWELRRARLDTTKGRPAHVDRWINEGRDAVRFPAAADAGDRCAP